MGEIQMRNNTQYRVFRTRHYPLVSQGYRCADDCPGGVRDLLARAAQGEDVADYDFPIKTKFGAVQYWLMSTTTRREEANLDGSEGHLRTTGFSENTDGCCPFLSNQLSQLYKLPWCLVSPSLRANCLQRRSATLPKSVVMAWGRKMQWSLLK